MGLFNIKLKDPDFYANVHEDSLLTIDKDKKLITIEEMGRSFNYEQSLIEETLLDAGGVLPLYGEYGIDVFRRITSKQPKARKIAKGNSGAGSAASIIW